MDLLWTVLEAVQSPFFGFKIDWYQLTFLRQAFLELHGFDTGPLLHHLFPGIKWIHLTRVDKISQAISAWRAMQTGVWHMSIAAEQPSWPAFDFEGIRQEYFSVCAEENLWQLLFESSLVLPLDIAYEAYLGNRGQVISSICSWLGAPDGDRDDDVLPIRVMRDETSLAYRHKFWRDIQDARIHHR